MGTIMIEIELPEWRHRVEVAVSESSRRRAARAALRRDMDKRRRYGVGYRQAMKLNRRSPFEP
jgi:hypothetical protein